MTAATQGCQIEVLCGLPKLLHYPNRCALTQVLDGLRRNLTTAATVILKVQKPSIDLNRCLRLIAPKSLTEKELSDLNRL